jgi:hypothetical protein
MSEKLKIIFRAAQGQCNLLIARLTGYSEDLISEVSILTTILMEKMAVT